MKHPLPLILGALGAVLAAVGFVFTRTEPIVVPLAPRVVSGAVESPPTCRAVGLMINGPLRTSTTQSEDLAFFGTFSKSRMAVELNFPEGGLFELAREASSVTEFGDDQGSNLLDPEDHFGPIEMMPRIAENGRSMLFVIGSKKMPSSEASSLRAEGTLSVWLSDASVQFQSETARLEKDESIVVGPYTFEVQSSGKSDWGEGWSTTLITREDPRAIKAWTLVDSEGIEHEWSNSMSMDGGGFWHRTLESETEITRAAIKVDAWKDPRQVEVPFRVEAGLGLR